MDPISLALIIAGGGGLVGKVAHDAEPDSKKKLSEGLVKGVAAAAGIATVANMLNNQSNNQPTVAQLPNLSGLNPNGSSPVLLNSGNLPPLFR